MRRHTQWRIPEIDRIDPAYLEAGDTIAFGQAVYDRRTELGLSQVELARRTRMTESQIAKLEGGGIVPTFPLLHLLTVALESGLAVTIRDEEIVVTFICTAT